MGQTGYKEYSEGESQLIKAEAGVPLPVFISSNLDDKAIKPNDVTERIGITWQERFRNLIWMFRVNIQGDVSKLEHAEFNLKANIHSKRPSLIKVSVDRKPDGLYLREV